MRHEPAFVAAIHEPHAPVFLVGVVERDLERLNPVRPEHTSLKARGDGEVDSQACFEEKSLKTRGPRCDRSHPHRSVPWQCVWGFLGLLPST